MADPRDEAFMRRAIEVARQTVRQGAGPPFGSIIVRGDEVVAEGANRVQAEGDPTWHGEVAAIRAACRKLGTTDLAGCTLYATGEPCPMCQGAIYLAGLDRLVFGSFANEDVRWQGCRYRLTRQELARPILERSLPASQVLAAEAGELFREFTRQKP